MAEIEVNGKKFKISTPLAKNPGQSSASRTVNTQRVNVAGVGQSGSRDHGNEGVYISSDYYRNDIVGKPYPGRVNFSTQRVLAYNSTVVRAILTLRSHQVAKLPITIIPKNKDEPPKQMSILEYNVYDLEHHPALDFEEIRFLTRIYARLDPKSYLSDKKAQYEEQIDEFTPGERATLSHLQEKHDDFYRKRQRDIKDIKKLLSKPDPWFTDTLSWESLIKKVLIDTLIIDRGALIKIREEGSNRIHGLMPIDGSCYSDDTEVLTEEGWKLFQEVDITSDRFATRSRLGKFEWQKATYFHKAPWNDEMIRFKSRTIDLLVSPNHRMLLSTTESTSRKGRNYKEFIKPAQEVELMRTKDYGIPRTSSWEGIPIPEQVFTSTVGRSTLSMGGTDFASFMGMYLAEGSVGKGKHIYISQLRKSKGWEKYNSLLTRLFPTVRYDGVSFVVNSTALVQYLHEYGVCYDKFIPDIIMNSTQEELESFWHYYILGDGHVEEGGRTRAVTTSKELADDLQELVQKMGSDASISTKAEVREDVYIGGRRIKKENIRPCYIVSTKTTKSTVFETERVAYSGDIHCVSVPNEVLYVRRNGQAAWSGNTLRPLINEFGTFDEEKAFVQVVNGTPRTYLSKKDVMIMSMNPMTDIKYYGYGFSMMETLYTTVLSDIFIDKGNLDYYRKGGSIPEGFISIEPPPSREGVVSQVDQEQLETIQRHLQSIMMGDYTQVPIVSGGKVSWIDFKGKRRDMQFKELAEYLTRKICAVYQVSPQDVGIISDVNRSTSQTQAEMTKSKGLETVMRTISEHFTNNVISELRPEDDLMLWFQDDDIEKEKERWQISQQKIVAGALTINQYRALEGSHPVPWGNTPLQGLRNWKPEDENSGGMPGMPNLGNLPPISGVPSPDNPNGPVGGENPMAGGPAQPSGGPAPVGSPTNLKSSRFFSLSAASEDDAEELMIKSFSNMYMENAKFSEFLELHDIHNYPGSSVLRTPIESYEFLARENRGLGIVVHKQVDVDEADPLVFSKYVGNGIIIVSEDGEEPIIKSMARAAFDSLNKDSLSPLRENLGSDESIREAIERSMYSRLDPGLKSFLYDDFYKFVTPNVTDAQVQEVGEYLGLK